jgi:hypothetical protein
MGPYAVRAFAEAVAARYAPDAAEYERQIAEGVA